VPSLLALALVEHPGNHRHRHAPVAALRCAALPLRCRNV